MDRSDLQQFLVLARLEHVGRAAEALHLSPSAVSKTLRKLEAELNMPLFDRVGRNLRINPAGRHLARRAGPLVQEFEQLESEVKGERGGFVCRIAGPALIQLNWGRQLAQHIAGRYPRSRVSFGNQDEASALTALERDEAEVALVSARVADNLPADYQARVLGQTTFKLAVGRTHPLVSGQSPPYRAAVSDVLDHDFVAPRQPHFRTLRDAPATDGWRDDELPRKIRYLSDDLLLVDGLVRSNLALAYLPDYVLDELGLAALDVPDCRYQCQIDVVLVHRPTRAHGWLNWLVDAMT